MRSSDCAPCRVSSLGIVPEAAAPAPSGSSAAGLAGLDTSHRPSLRRTAGCAASCAPLVSDRPLVTRGGTMSQVKQHKFQLAESEMPSRWYNVLHDLPTPPPPVLHPGTGQPVGPDDLAPLFPMALILQEVSTEQYVDIPEEVLDVYRLWRPSPLYRAHRLEKALGTPARIYYKYEGVSPAGSHKPNTAVP